MIAGRLEETWAIQVKSMTPAPKDIVEVQQASRRWWVNWAIMWKPSRKPWTTIAFQRGKAIEEAPQLTTPEKETQTPKE